MMVSREHIATNTADVPVTLLSQLRLYGGSVLDVGI